MGQNFSSDDYNEEADTLLDSLEEAAYQSKSLEEVAASKELNDFRKEHDAGNIKSNDMSYFLLSLNNHCDEDTKRIKMRGGAKKQKRNKAGIRKLALQILDVNFDIFKIILSPAEALIKMTMKLAYIKKRHHVVKEKNGQGMLYLNKRFKNWGLNIRTKKKIRTFVPKSKVGLCNLVKWAKSKSLSVRVSGYRHSWSDITVNDGQVLVSLLPPFQVDTLPANEQPIDKSNELQGIELLDNCVREDGVTKRLCRIGSATTNEQFRQWVIDNSLDEKNDCWQRWWTLPLNVIMVEITFGGSNGPICHGAGKGTTTLSDLVAAIEFVNANGNLQVVDDPVQLKSASGCFGMLGLVTSITMKLDPLTFARMIPKKKPLPLTIPPPKGFDVPREL